MPDIMTLGGVTGWLSAMALAQAASLPVSSRIVPEASAHAMAVTPTAHHVDWLDLSGAVLADAPRVERGVITPEGPGLGIARDEAAVARLGS